VFNIDTHNAEIDFRAQRGPVYTIIPNRRDRGGQHISAPGQVPIKLLSAAMAALGEGA
jgi:hypothetical protein